MSRGARIAVVAVVAGVGLIVAAWLGDSTHRTGSAPTATSAGPGGGPEVALTVTPSTPGAPPTTAAPATTGTTLDPGSQPQTAVRPSATDPAFAARIQELWRAVVDGDPSEARPAFFPLGAYIQVKAISDPEQDYRDRLIADFDQDIDTIHAALGAGAASARFTGVAVPSGGAVWIEPGVEYNKGSYWRVYGTEVSYVAGGRPGSFEIHSMISWRGEWYVVHLGPIR